VSYRTLRRLRRTVLTLLATAVAVVFIFPLYWITVMSFQDGVTASRLPPTFIFWPSLHNYTRLFEESGFGRVMLNTTIIAVGTTVLALLLGTPAAYALARFRVGSAEQISFTILSVRMVPSYVAVVPLFIILQYLGLFATIAGVILASALGGIAFVIWMMRAFFVSVPLELEQAAMIDGCSRPGAVMRVVMPIVAPGMVATSVFTAIAAWNEFLFVLILGGERAKNMQVVLASMVTDQRAEWGQLAAGGVLTMLPVIVIALLVRRYFLEGLTAGSVNA
jgi:multiple sugar transport system permease protein